MKSVSVRVPLSPLAETMRLAHVPGTVGQVFLLSILQRTSYNTSNAETHAAKKKASII